MNGNESVGVMVVDDHEIFRHGLRLLIESNPRFQVVGECGRLSEVDDVISQANPDLTLLDLHFDDGSGLEFINKLAEKSKLIVLTADTNPNVHEECLKAGANGLVLKEMASKELFDAMIAVCSGEMWFEKSLMGKIVRELTRPSSDGPVDIELQRIQTLSPRELEVIKLVGEGLSNRTIAERLYISETTVRHHMTSILSKLDVASRLELVVFAYRHGLAMLPDRVQR